MMSLAEVLAAQDACTKAWEESRLRNGIDRMKLIYKAFPYAVNGGGSGLRLTWVEEFNGLGLADSGGFLTLIDDGDILQQLFHLLSLESRTPGAVRALITGVPLPERALEDPQVPKILEKKLSLKDLDL